MSSFIDRKTEVFVVPLERVLNFTIPRLQRSLNEDYVRQIVEDERAEMTQHGCFSILQSMTVARLDDELFVVDGQHRLKAFGILKTLGYSLNDVTLPIVVHRVRDKTELSMYYCRINKHNPIHPLELQSTWEQVEGPFIAFFTSKYRNYIKPGTKTHCPYVGVEGLKSALHVRNAGERLVAAGVAAQKLCDAVSLFNEWVRHYYQTSSSRVAGLSADLYKRLGECLAKSAEDACFVGAWRRFEWLDYLLHCIEHNKSISEADVESLTRESCGKRRERIPASVRKRVWANANDEKSLLGKCFTCERSLEFTDMECGHVVPLALGGPTTVENMMPVCRTCNRDMGIMHLEAYKRLIQSMMMTDS